MLRMLSLQLRARLPRAAVLGVGILVAATSFSLLTAATDASEARVQGAVASNFISTYDLLVRPPGSQSQLERERGLVRNNFETGIFGGITQRQWQRIGALPGIAVAAPVAYLGWVNQYAATQVRIGRYMALDQPVQLRFATSSQTGRPVTWHRSFYWVVTKSGLCPQVYVRSPPQRTAFDPDDYGLCAAVGGDGVSNFVKSVSATSFGVGLSFPLLVAAVDPVEENRLVGLDRAVTSGQSLREGLRSREGPLGPVLPVLASSRSFRDQTSTLTVERLHVPKGMDPARLLIDKVGPNAQGTGPSTNWARLNAMSRTPVGSFSFTGGQLYRELRRAWTLPIGDHHRSPSFITWVTSPVSYRAHPDGSLSPIPVSNPSSTWRKQTQDTSEPFWPTPDENSDVQFRRLTPQVFTDPTADENSASHYLDLRLVGEFDPQRLPGFSELSRVPLETYRSPRVQGGDARSRRLLRGEALGPTSNLGGYVAQPPLLLTTLSAADAMTSHKWFGTRGGRALPNASAPISVIRVRVAGVTGPDDESVARLRSAASLIARATGLTVDVTAGSSPQPQTIRLPSGKFGQPALTVTEGWTRKGVALLIVSAVDRKSQVLFGLILLVTVSFLVNASFASLRARRSEIGTLATVGWLPGQVFRLVVGELALIGAVAGVTGAALSVVLIEAADLRLSLTRVLLIPPVALGLALVAGAVPALRAAHTTPIAALAPPVSDAARARVRVRSIAGYAGSCLARRAGRTVLSAVTLGLAVACLAGLLTATFAFRGAVAGSLLGTYVTVQIRAVDYLSAGLAIGLACFSVADLLALTLRERAGEIVTLKATGWANRHLTRATLLEALGIAALGSLPGAGIAVAVAVVLGAPTGISLLAAGTATAIGALLVLALAMAPAHIATRTSIAAVLADE